MKPLVILGVDPGTTGALALVTAQPDPVDARFKLLEVEDMPALKLAINKRRDTRYTPLEAALSPRLMEEAGIPDDAPVAPITRAGEAIRSEIDPAALSAIIRDMMERHTIQAAWFETVRPRYSDGKVQAWGFGRSVGHVEGVLAALAIPINYVAPQSWMSYLRVGRGAKGQRVKDGSRRAASTAFPDMAGHWTRIKDHGRCDAALIGLYGAYHS